MTLAEFCASLRVERRRAGVSASAVADHLGCVESQVNRYERGSAVPDARLRDWAAFLSVDVPDDVVGWRPDTDMQPCGTVAAYGRHVARGERPCRPCAAARVAYDRARPPRPSRRAVS